MCPIGTTSFFSRKEDAVIFLRDELMKIAEIHRKKDFMKLPSKVGWDTNVPSPSFSPGIRGPRGRLQPAAE
jgi:hypothetical protein